MLRHTVMYFNFKLLVHCSPFERCPSPAQIPRVSRHPSQPCRNLVPSQSTWSTLWDGCHCQSPEGLPTRSQTNFLVEPCPRYTWRQSEFNHKWKFTKSEVVIKLYVIQIRIHITGQRSQVRRHKWEVTKPEVILRFILDTSLRFTISPRVKRQKS